MNLQHWRIEDGRYACFDIYEDGRKLDTYEVDLAKRHPPGYSWAQHISRKKWAYPAMIQELEQLEEAYQNEAKVS